MRVVSSPSQVRKTVYSTGIQAAMMVTFDSRKDQMAKSTVEKRMSARLVSSCSSIQRTIPQAAALYHFYIIIIIIIKRICFVFFLSII
jgi:hypothetical protein